MQDERQMKNQEGQETPGQEMPKDAVPRSASEEGFGEEEQFAFLQEKVKPKEKKQGKGIAKLLGTAALGLVFGGFACVSFYMLTPWMENVLQGEKGAVTIPEDEEPPEEEVVQEDVVQEVPVLTLEDYQDMMESLYSIARDAEKSLVVVRVSDDEAWMADDGRDMRNVTGMIAADNGWEVLIVADDAVCTGDAGGENPQWSVTFSDGSSCSATLKKRDKTRGLAVFSVNRMLLSDSTKNNIHKVVWGNSNIAARGDVVIALGNMFGYDNGLGYGIISSKKYDELFADASCGVLATDIAVTSGGNGVLINQKGEVLGLIRGEIWSESSGATANALAISDLKPVLEMLLNGESVPYIGIQGMTVTDVISSEQGLPRGVYVTQVREDSPAMYAGIQNGDIIQKVGGTEVTGTSSYEKAVLKCTAGTQVRVRGKRRGNGGYVDVEFAVTVGSQE